MQNLDISYQICDTDIEFMNSLLDNLEHNIEKKLKGQFKDNSKTQQFSHIKSYFNSNLMTHIGIRENQSEIQSLSSINKKEQFEIRLRKRKSKTLKQDIINLEEAQSQVKQVQGILKPNSNYSGSVTSRTPSQNRNRVRFNNSPGYSSKIKSCERINFNYNKTKHLQVQSQFKKGNLRSQPQIFYAF